MSQTCSFFLYSFFFWLRKWAKHVLLSELREELREEYETGWVLSATKTNIALISLNYIYLQTLNTLPRLLLIEAIAEHRLSNTVPL